MFGTGFLAEKKLISFQLLRVMQGNDQTTELLQ